MENQVGDFLMSNVPPFFLIVILPCFSLWFDFEMLLSGGGERMLEKRVNLMWKCRLSRIYPFEKRPFHLFCWFIP